MVNAQEWLDRNYPKEGRKEVKKLDINNKSLEGYLDLSDFVNLEELTCNNNQLTDVKLNNCLKLESFQCWSNQFTNLNFTNLNQLKSVTYAGNHLSEVAFPPRSEQLLLLNIAANDFPPQNLSIFDKLINLQYFDIRVNRFYGSLKPLKKTKLYFIDISDTDIDSGLEYLPNAGRIHLSSVLGREDAKVKILEQELRKYGEPVEDKWRKYNYANLLPLWKNDHPDKMKIVQQEWQIEGLTNQLNNKQNQIASLEKEVKELTDEKAELQSQLTGNQTIINNFQNELTAWKTSLFWPQLSWNQPNSAITFRTQLNSFDLAGTAALCFLARHLYRKYKTQQVLPQDEERQPLLRTPEEVARLNQETNHLKSELSQIAKIISPEEEINNDNLKQKITRLKYQELALQVRDKRVELERLITEAKSKVGNSEKTIDLLLETQKQTIQTSEISQKDKLNGKLEAYQSILADSLSKEELQNLLTKQTELQQLEKHLDSLQQIQQQALQIQPAYGTPGSSQGGNH